MLRHFGGDALSWLNSSSSKADMENGCIYQAVKDSNPHAIRWRKGELIGAGAYGRVYMGMNLESGELLAVKQVLISVNGVARDKAQNHIRELEEEVKLLKNLSHPNIVCYLGTAREQDALNIFLEFVPGGSIASLLGKFGSFPESVVRMYTRQLLQGLEYLHKNGIMHRDIKGANILVDNKGCIKLADFGASKQVAELATMSGAKSMKGTPYWMAPEVIRQTGHGLPADIWSVGCTVIEMATGKPPWSQQFQEVAALFHIGTTKSHPPIPEHLSLEAKDFLLKCLKKEPNLRPTSTELLQHPFVVGEVSDNEVGTALFPSAGPPCDQEQQPIETWTSMENSTMQFNADDLNCSVRLDSMQLDSFRKSYTPLYELSSFNPIQEPVSSFNPIQEPGSSFNPIQEPGSSFNPLNVWESGGQFEPCGTLTQKTGQDHVEFTFPCAPVDDDEEVTESKIKAFLDEKALELKKLQTPLYEEFHNICNASLQNEATESYIAPLTPAFGRQFTTNSKSPSKGSSLSGPSLGPGSCNDSEASVSSGSPAGNSSINLCPLSEVTSPRLNELRGLLQETQQLLPSPSILNSTERQKLWKEELQQELEMMREEKRLLSRLGNNNSKSPSPKDRPFQRHIVSRLSLASPSRLPL